ncbi:TetR/AcrR family transcriptional regulator [Ruania alkalisoli]|uniref:TetR/AcrR family transcriptional regulator n=1 Tax=Ruania alkalisoli TaxID=2779775 RepID=A0A7M1SQK4_9MICO|nr:TetR/AcrR family transcriptional regulator [Ruania alkalisoli]QOR69735.1 TetR/AcrR family transcriptional regulator [Ruania alkalisoli]
MIINRTHPAPSVRSDLVRTGIRIFGHVGFGIGLREIAAEAGVTAGSVTYHFGGKAGLRSACDRQVLDDTRVHLPMVVSSGEREVRLRGNSRTHLHNLRYLMRSLAESTALVEPLIDLLLESTRTEVLAHYQTDQPDPDEVDAAATRVIRRALGVAMLDHALAAPHTAEDLRVQLTAWRDIARGILESDRSE